MVRSITAAGPVWAERPVATRTAAGNGRHHLRRVALLIETSGSYGRGLLRGVAKYNREKAGWSTYFHPHGFGDPPHPWLSNWEGNGILAQADTPEIAELLAAPGVPVVNLGPTMQGALFPYVGVDHRMIGMLAAEHLLLRKWMQYGIYGGDRGVDSGLDERRESFRRAVGQAGVACHEFRASRPQDQRPWEQAQERLASWIVSLPKPIGIMAVNDEHGLQLLDACRRCGAHVPDEVAVIGVDNDEHLCELSIPPLSSIDVNSEQIGYTAAALLDRMIDGESPPAEALRIPPRQVVVRRSTDITASEDEDVNRALRYIRETGSRGLQVNDVLTHTGMSRATLQQRMKQLVGRTIHEEIERVRLARVQELLLKPGRTIKQVSREAGFSSVQYMTRVFRRAVGETPAAYRERRVI